MIFILAIARRLRPAPRSSAFQFDVSSNVDFALHPSYTHVPLFPSVFLPKHKDGRAFINSPLPREGNLILVPLPGYHIHYVRLSRPLALPLPGHNSHANYHVETQSDARALIFRAPAFSRSFTARIALARAYSFELCRVHSAPERPAGSRGATRARVLLLFLSFPFQETDAPRSANSISRISHGRAPARHKSPPTPRCQLALIKIDPRMPE
jgi:hypothetical protein